MLRISARPSLVRGARLVLTLVAVGIVLGGCGSSDDGSTAEITTTTAASASAEGATSTTASPDPADLTLTSSAFDDGASLPARFSCTAEGVSPPLSWSGLPEGTTSLALLVVDSGASSATAVPCHSPANRARGTVTRHPHAGRQWSSLVD